MTTTQAGGSRLDQILRWVQVEGRLDVADAAARLGVAQETVRRDLRTLELEQKLQRVHGGAVPVAVPVPPTGPVDDQLDFARRVWKRLPRTGTIMIGAGRLVPALAQAIVAQPPETEGLTVVTNHLDVAVALSRAPRLSVYNIGGTVNRHTHAQEGDWALTELTRLHTDVAVVCPPGVDEERGITECTPAAAAITRAVVDGARRVLVLADRRSLGSRAFVQACALDEVDELAVTADVGAERLRPYRERGVAVIGWDDATAGANDSDGEGTSDL